MNLVHSPIPTIKIIGSPITALPFEQQIGIILRWASAHMSKVVCVANTHMLVEAYRDQEFYDVLQHADLVTPDGMPLVWMLKLLGIRHQNRVAGMDILLALCEQASNSGVSIFFLGSQPKILSPMQTRFAQEFPKMRIAGMEPLPFRPLTPEEDKALIQRLNNSGAGIVVVSLGCPKQERWMAKHRGKVHAVMIGLGGVFPIYAGIYKRAPRWMRDSGLEWFYRLLQEPQRLLQRYSSTLPAFIWLALMQFFQKRG